MPSLLWIGLATLVSEDLACIAAGVLIAKGELAFLPGTLACVAGIFCGDLLLYLAGRAAGRAARYSAAFSRLAPPEKVARASEWLTRRGPIVILLSRFTPGLRLPTYFAAGLLRTRFWRFAILFLAASAIWTPLLVGAATVFGEQALRDALHRRGSVLFALVAIAAAVVVWRKVLGLMLDRRARRLFAGFLKRKIRWEFWPPWAAYLPLVPYLAMLAARYRSLSVFTAANPGIASGGFLGESKSEILHHLSKAEGAVPAYDLIPIRLQVYARFQQAREFLQREGLRFPVVLKPDVGERGSGVAIVRSTAELEDYLRAATQDTIIQKYVGGREFGVFYYRRPGEAAGHVFSITEKRFPEVLGDGRRTIEELILQDARAVCMAKTYLSRCPRPADDVPGPGEPVGLVELGSHCKGAIFLDGRHLITPELEAAIERISRHHPGFYFGRYDIRTPSIEALREGRNLQVIELNGVSAEATHIYDPAISIFQAYRSLGRQWKLAFEIGAENRRRGYLSMTGAELVQLIRARLAGTPLPRVPGRQQAGLAGDVC